MGCGTSSKRPELGPPPVQYARFMPPFAQKDIAPYNSKSPTICSFRPGSKALVKCNCETESCSVDQISYSQSRTTDMQTERDILLQRIQQHGAIVASVAFPDYGGVVTDEETKTSYLIAGSPEGSLVGSRTLYAFDHSGNDQNRKNDLHIGRHTFGFSAYDKDTMLIAGGNTSEAEKSCEAYDYRTETWEIKHNLPVGLKGPSLVRFKTDLDSDAFVIYCIGGHRDLGATKGDQIFMLPQIDQTWNNVTINTLIPKLQFQRMAGAIQITPDDIFIFGGRDNDYLSKQNYLFKISTAEVILLKTDLPNSDMFCAGEVKLFNNKVFAISYSQWGLNVFDFKSYKWEFKRIYS